MTSKSPEEIYDMAVAASMEVIPTLPKYPYILNTGIHPVKPSDVPPGLKWVRPSLWQRLVYLFNAPRYLVFETSEPLRKLD